MNAYVSSEYIDLLSAHQLDVTRLMGIMLEVAGILCGR